MRQEFARHQIMVDEAPSRSMRFGVSLRGLHLVPMRVDRARPPRHVPVGMIVFARVPFVAHRGDPSFGIGIDREAAPSADAALEPVEERASFRTLLPEPGVWRVVRLGDFKPMLAPQMAHAERLQDSHRLPCYAQVYEAARPQHVEALAAAVVGAPEQVTQLHPLTPQIAARLELVPLLASPRPARRRPDPGMLMPFERVVRLQLATDPSRSVGAKEQAAAEDHDTVGAASNASIRTGIPDQLIRPWEFRLSREEAVYDMHAAAPRFPALTGLVRRLARRLRHRDELGKWHALLAAKSRDEQLWAVRPPRGGYSDSAVRGWAARVLELAGYDPRTMLPEWEIFWRRKGL